MSDINQVKNEIKEELEKGLPSKRKILSYLLDLLNKDKYPPLSDFEFYDIVGYTYKLNLNYKLNLEPLFYPIYNALKKKFKKLYGKEKRFEMEQYLRENFGLKGPEKYRKNRQIQDSPLSLSTKIKYVVFLLALITGLIALFLGVFVYFFVSRAGGITLSILGLILIVSSICFISGTKWTCCNCACWYE